MTEAAWLERARWLPSVLPEHHSAKELIIMRFVSTLIVAASIGMAASVVAPSANAGVVVGVSLPLPIVAPAIVATVPAPAVYVNPAVSLYAPGYYYGAYRGCYACGYGYGYRYGYRGYVHQGYEHGVAFAHRR
jgi:hypothetical protein